MNKQEKIKILDKIIQQENCYGVECDSESSDCPLYHIECRGGIYGKYPELVKHAKQEKERLTTNRIIFNDSTYVDIRIIKHVLYGDSVWYKTVQIKVTGNVDNNLFRTLIRVRNYYYEVPLYYKTNPTSDRIIELLEKLINSIDVINLRLKEIVTKEV